MERERTKGKERKGRKDPREVACRDKARGRGRRVRTNLHKGRGLELVFHFPSGGEHGVDGCLELVPG